MLKSCKYCNRIHDSKYDCGKKPQHKKQGNDKDKFRWTKAWQDKRKEIKQRDLFLCAVCKDSGKYNYDDLEVHHIESLESNFDLRLENENLITLCSMHHEEAETGKLNKNYLYNLINKSNAC